MGSNIHIAEQYAQAVHSLVGPGTLQERLQYVATLGDEEAIKAATAAMSDQEAQAVAGEIVSLSLDLDRQFRIPGAS